MKIKDFILSLLSESSVISSTRFVHVVGLFMAFTIAMVGIWQQADLYAVSVLCVSFIVPQSIAKVMQKKAEVLKK